MIPLAIAIGIIEDKIANDLTGNKSTKEHLEELKEKFKEKAKNKYSVDIELIRPITQIDKNGDLHNIDHFLFGDVSRVEESENFFIVYTGSEKEYLDICNIQRISVKVVEE